MWQAGVTRTRRQIDPYAAQRIRASHDPDERLSSVRYAYVICHPTLANIRYFDKGPQFQISIERACSTKVALTYIDVDQCGPGRSKRS